MVTITLDVPVLLRPEAAATYLGIDVPTLRKWREFHGLPVVRLGKRTYYDQDALDKFIGRKTPIKAKVMA